jgi:ribonuclease HI
MMGKHRSRRRNKRTKYLYATHNVRTIADLLKTKRRIDQKEGEQKHRRDVRYKCSDCKLDKERGCASPWRCAEEAKEMLLDIRPKWNAQETRYEDGLSLRSPEKEHNKENTQERGLVTFDPLVTVKTNVNGCIQIFVDPFRSADTPAVREQPPARGRTSHDSKIVVYTDGSSLNNRSAIATCGSGVWFGENDERNIATRPPTEDQSNQVGEIAAVILAARAVPDFVELEIRSDSLTTIEGLTQHLETWENRGWIGVKNSEILRVAAYQLRKRSAPTRFQWVKGHSGDTGNEEADKLAGEAAKRPEKDNMNLEIPLEFRITGARLDSMTQALAYRAIKARKHAPKPRGRTASNVTETQDALAGYAGTPPTTQRIWRSIRHKDWEILDSHTRVRRTRHMQSMRRNRDHETYPGRVQHRKTEDPMGPSRGDMGTRRVQMARHRHGDNHGMWPTPAARTRRGRQKRRGRVCEKSPRRPVATHAYPDIRDSLPHLETEKRVYYRRDRDPNKSGNITVEQGDRRPSENGQNDGST